MSAIEVLITRVCVTSNGVVVASTLLPVESNTARDEMALLFVASKAIDAERTRVFGCNSGVVVAIVLVLARESGVEAVTVRPFVITSTPVRASVRCLVARRTQVAGTTR